MRRRFLLWLALVYAALGSWPLAAETVAVAPGISVSRRGYGGPINEQPFYGFREKSPQELSTDKNLRETVAAGPGPEVASGRLLALAAQAITSGDLSLAARRYNQAYLLKPDSPEIYHGFAIIAHARFKDAAYAEELFAIASRLKPGDPAILADQARLFLMLGRPAEAMPLLEIVVRDPHAGAMHWANLGFAYVQTGQNAKACDALAKAREKMPAPTANNEFALLQKSAGC